MKTFSVQNVAVSGVCCGMALISSFLIPNSSFGQGALTPPGAPAPTMKTLDQVEPRTPISALPYTISASGSYILTTNLSCSTCTNQIGILINANDVTLDLQGFTITGIANAFSGVAVAASGRTNITVRNGSARDWGHDGFFLGNARSGVLVDLRAFGNFGYGVLAGPGSIVTRCVASANSNGGIVTSSNCTISVCEATDNIVMNISVGDGCMVANCVAAGSLGAGIQTGERSTVMNCRANNNRGSGIVVQRHSHVLENSCDGNRHPDFSTGAGIVAGGGNNRIDSNHVTDNDTGIVAGGGGSPDVVIRNSAQANGINYDFGGGLIAGPTNNLVGPGGIITNVNPWANFSN